MSINNLPIRPAIGDTGEVFSARADALLAALPAWAVSVNDYSVVSSQSLAAANSAMLALSAQPVPIWQSGVSYNYNDIVMSPIDGLLYRAGLAYDTAHDPSAELNLNWTRVSDYVAVDVSKAQTLVNKRLATCKAKTVKCYSQSYAGSSRDLSLSDYGLFDLTLSANLTLTFSNQPSAVSNVNQEFDVIIRRTGGSSYTVTWPTITWQITGITAPANAQIAHYKINYSSATNSYVGRLVGYKA